MEAQAAQSLINTILLPANLAVVVGVWVLITTLHKAVPELKGKGWWARLQPVLPLVLCTAALWIPGAAQADQSAADRILLGLLLGFAVGHAHKIVKQTGMGADARINGNGK